MITVIRRNITLAGLESRASYYRGAGVGDIGRGRASYYRGAGVGFLPAAIAVAPAAGPAAPIIAAVGVVGSIFGKIFGGDDQKTSYRPPGNARDMFFDVAGQQLAFDMSNLVQAQMNGNRADDLYSYYSAFINGNTSQASKAARNVIEKQSKEQGVSVREMAARILTVAGVPRIVGGFLPSGGSSSASMPTLPGYCPPGTYHPFPIGDPRANECAPFPIGPGGSSGGTGPGQQQPIGPGDVVTAGITTATTILQVQAAQRAAQRAQQAQMNGRCTAGLYFDQATQRCMPYPVCGTGLTFDPLLPGCVEGQGGLEAMPSWVWLLLLALGVVIISR